MANPFAKAWKYFLTSFDMKVEEKADPRVQIEQAIAEAEKQHNALSQQAATVIGHQRQLEMKLGRELENIEKLQANTKQALRLADDARAAGDNAKATEYTNAAESFAAQLVTAEASVEDLKLMHDQALQQAAQAKQAVERNAMTLQQKAAERTKLLGQLEQAKMQERVAESLTTMTAQTNANVPNLDQVREKIESRYAKALGQAELAQGSVQNRMAEVEHASHQLAGHSRLNELRAEMNAEQKSVEAGGAAGAQAITSGPSAADKAAADQGTTDAVAERLKQLRDEK